MKLEIAEFPVGQIRLGQRFAYENEVLEVDEVALIALVLEDRRITEATLGIAAPGEATRITGFATSSSRDLKFPAAVRFSPASWVRSKASAQDEPIGYPA